MLINCPTCNKQLMAPDDMAGQSLRCPACQNVFSPSANGAAFAPPPPPARMPDPSPPMPPPPPVPPPPPQQTLPQSLPEVLPAQQKVPYPAGRVPPQGSPWPERNPDQPELPRDVLEVRARSAAMWMSLGALVAIGVTVFNILIFVMMMPNIRGDDWIGVLFFGGCAMFIITPLVIFVLVGAHNLRSLTNKGLVITGSVMNFILGGLFCIMVFVNGIATLVASVERNWRQGPNPIFPLIALFVVTAAAFVNIFAGVKAVSAIKWLDMAMPQRYR